MKRLLLTLSLLTMIDLETAQAIDVQGHRGARAVLPENSLPALEHALALGVDTLEFDTGVSKDGVVIVMHDQTINPVICQYKDGSEIENELWLHQLTLAQIKEFDCGSKRNPRFDKQALAPGTEIPTLAEVFEMVKHSSHPTANSVRFNIETKSNPDLPHAQSSAKEFVEAIATLVHQYGFESRVILQSFDPATLIAAKEFAPELQRSILLRHKPDDWVEAAEAVDADIISPHHSVIDRGSVRAIQDAGLAVIPWTANSKRQWTRLIKLEVDGIITDDPEALLTYLERK